MTATQNVLLIFQWNLPFISPLKIYSGGLGFLAGSHLRSAYELRQNLIGIGILWKYGYYDQARNQDQSLQVTWMEKMYSYLEDTGIKFQILIHESPVWVKAFYLTTNTFNSAPLFLLSTDFPKTIIYRKPLVTVCTMEMYLPKLPNLFC